jgi:hypothetical protein
MQTTARASQIPGPIPCFNFPSHYMINFDPWYLNSCWLCCLIRSLDDFRFGNESNDKAYVATE